MPVTREVGDLHTLVEGFRHINWQTVLASLEAVTQEHEQLLKRYRTLARAHEDLRQMHEHLRGDRQGHAAATRESDAELQEPLSGAEEPAAMDLEQREVSDPVVVPPLDRHHGSGPSDLLDELARRRIGERGLFWIGHLALQDLDDRIFAETVLDHLMRVLGSDAVLMILRDDEGNFTRCSKGDPVLRGELARRLPTAFNELVTTAACATYPLIGSDGAATALAVLIPGRGPARGLLTVGRAPQTGCFWPDEQEFLLTYAQTTAVALDRRRLRQDIEGHLLDAVGLFVAALEAKDPYLQGHSARVSLYAGEIAASLGLAAPQAAVTRRTGLLHDLGKLMILDAIRLKPGGLTEEEYAQIRRSPVIAAQILRPLPFLGPEAAAVRHHLERYDGTGYPDGLKREAIPFPARIVTVADAFDAMTSPRPYRTPRPFEAAFTEILRNAGTQFDPDVARAFTSAPFDRLISIGRSYRGIQGPVKSA